MTSGTAAIPDLKKIVERLSDLSYEFGELALFDATAEDFVAQAHHVLSTLTRALELGDAKTKKAIARMATTARQVEQDDDCGLESARTLGVGFSTHDFLSSKNAVLDIVEKRIAKAQAIVPFHRARIVTWLARVIAYQLGISKLGGWYQRVDFEKDAKIIRPIIDETFDVYADAHAQSLLMIPAALEALGVDAKKAKSAVAHRKRRPKKTTRTKNKV